VASAVLLCTDGSDLALAALARGLAVVAPADRVVVATVVELTHPVDVVGTGMAGGVLSPDAAARADDASRRDGQQALDDTCRHLGLTDAETIVLDGDAGAALCELAGSLPAAVMVIGTRGRGGLRRAVLGSVSDHVVRNAPCPVVVCTPL
jgi:nucleotide-binding universal stress UspA family protein